MSFPGRKEAALSHRTPKAALKGWDWRRLSAAGRGRASGGQRAAAARTPRGAPHCWGSQGSLEGMSRHTH